MNNLTIWWQWLETNFPLSGPRGHLHSTFGTAVVDGLERAGVLKMRGVTERYPCPRPSGTGCPRVVIELDDGFHAICGNRRRTCPDIALSRSDVAHLTADVERLCRVLADALQVRPKVEQLQPGGDTYRLGAFIPEPGIRHSVFLVVRTSAAEYQEALDALRTHQQGQAFATLVPTDRFLGETTVDRLRADGLPIISLADFVALEGDNLVALTDPLFLLGGIGQAPRSGSPEKQTVAHAFVKETEGQPRWITLDEARYTALKEATTAYDVFADERDRTVRRKYGTQKTSVATSHFKTIKAAATKRGRYDPNIEGPDLTAGKQTFQRARPVFDIKTRTSEYAIFKSVRTEDGHTVYRLAPDDAVSFAFLFLPE